MTEYVHGYSEAEAVRLHDQARTLEDILHHDTTFPPGATVLEAGCGTGGQTIALARRNPQARIIAIDRSAGSLAQAQMLLAQAGLRNVRFEQADLFDLPVPPGSVDHVFLCFVLEHLPDPAAALVALRAVLRRTGTITVIEGDHGSTYFHPESPAARDAIACQVALQHRAGGDAMIGRRLYPLLTAAGFERVEVSPRLIYVDDSRPDLVEGFTRRTFTAMIEGVRGPALAAGLITPERFDAGIAALERTAELGGTFCYTFFKATASPRMPK